MKSTLNNVRFDLSPYLIHFFKALDLHKADDAFTPEDWGPGEIIEDTVISPLFLLRNAVRLQRLWATWSVRGGRRTVYGPHAAVCFTDMPVAAFIEAGRARQARGEAMSPIAIVLPKADVHAAGARPVIYGLSGHHSIPTGRDGGPRILASTILPRQEQYRYVTLGDYGSVDWTHEREWRWPYRGEPLEYDGTPPADGKDIPGLDLGFKGMGVIVRSKRQATKVLHDLLVLSDMGAAGRYDFILVGDAIPSLRSIREPARVQAALRAASVDLSPFLKMDAGRRKQLCAAFDACVAAVDRNKISGVEGEVGGVWLWLTDATHEVTRALLLSNRVKINAEGRYLVSVGDLCPDLSLAKREELVRRLASLLKKRHGLSATYHSVLGKFDPDGIPHYSNPPIENRLIFNYGHDTVDF